MQDDTDQTKSCTVGLLICSSTASSVGVLENEILATCLNCHHFFTYKMY